ncbi:hypothetical protein [Adlercreutzia sp. ZJ304]|uniref:hypothetical protein n=1 Tax=Adlercreutzia sp. ZJ304 TaxID=2709791 RepID=UPI0013E9ADD3|nr:hypothetical protein [Adlercreutzia sp. ZJ304]
MKKTSKVLSAIGLSAALAVGTALPAFAAPAAPFDEIGESTEDNPAPKVDEYGQVDNGATENFKDTNDSDSVEKKEATASTEAYLGAVTYQIDATLPLKIAMVGDMGGGKLMTPHSGIYTITNNNDQAGLVVSGIETEMYAGDGVTVTTGTTQVDWLPSKGEDIAIAEDPTSYNPYIKISDTDEAQVSAKYGVIAANLTAGYFDSTANVSDSAKKADRTFVKQETTAKIVGDVTADAGGSTYVQMKKTINNLNYIIPRKGNTTVESAGDASGKVLANELGLQLDVASSKLLNYNEEAGFVKAFTIKFTVRAPQHVADLKKDSTGNTDFFDQWDMYKSA